VYVPDRLAAVGTRVEDNAVSGVRHALGNRHVLRVGDHIGQQPRIGRREGRQIRVMLARDHKYVNGSLRINVTERDRPGITGHYGRRYVAGGNTAKQAVRHADDLNVYRADNAADIYGCSTANPRCTTPLVPRPRQVLAPLLRGESCAGAAANA
jgi:hypothetical protein